MQIRRSQIESAVQTPATPAVARSEDDRAKGASRHAVIAGLATLLLAGSAVGSTVAPTPNVTTATVHDQFATAFAAGPADVAPCCSVRLENG
ncbi:MAG: hypothetical protein QOI74_1105 [Micromonosporaceae bacterium]|jgi:hypothetical protein|nr:hypothetical protein [Micromonosporaceae bacterium]